MNDKFPMLALLSFFIKSFGLLLVLTGIYYGVYQGIIEPNLPGHSFGTGDSMELGGGLLALFFGLVSLIIAESLGVMLAIESNTRNAPESE